MPARARGRTALSSIPSGTVQAARFYEMKELMKDYVIFDGRNLYDPVKIENHGFKYFGVGIGTPQG
jgi:hypothetical protein